MLSLILALTAGHCAHLQAASHAAPAPHMRKARDPEVAVKEELSLARSAGTQAAYDLFIARHPGHPLSQVARDERERLARK